MGQRKKSRKRSASTAEPDKPPDEPKPVLFVDHSLGTKLIPKLLQEAGYDVEVLADHFEPNAKDEDWIGEVAKKKWVILTADRRISKNELEYRVVVSSGAAYVCITSSIGGQAQGERLVEVLPRVLKVISVASRPVLIRILKSECRIRIGKEWTVLKAQHTNPNFWRKLPKPKS